MCSSDLPSSCWFNNGSTNSIITCGQAVTTNLAMHVGSNTWIIYANDTLGTIGSASVIFNYDPILPIINSISLNNHDTSTDLSYSASKSVLISIRYGTNSAYINQTLNTTSYYSSNQVTISGLINNTFYYYNITIMDRAQNRVQYGPFNFTTTNGTCYTDAICSDWGMCSAIGLQSRTCNKIYINCEYSTLPALTRPCNYVLPPTDPILTSAPNSSLNTSQTNQTRFTLDLKGLSSGTKTIIIGLIIFIVGAGIIWLIIRFRNPPTNDIIPQDYDQPYNPPDNNPDDQYLDDNT